MEKLKRKLAAVGIVVMLLSYFISDADYSNSHYEILDSSEEAFALCSSGYVYIGDHDYLESICPKEGDILVEDMRCEEDPNMKIYSSCDVRSARDRNEILEILQEYERLNPSDWDRSLASMRLEWLFHNLAYQFSYKTDHSEDVDLNNNDESIYDHKLLQKVFHTN